MGSVRHVLGGACLLIIACCGPACALNATTIQIVSTAADTFVALSKDAAASGNAPRQSDQTVADLLDLVLDTSVVQKGPVPPISELEQTNAWLLAALKVGVVYMYAGTGSTDVATLPNTPEAAARVEQNVIKFAPEMGRYYDAASTLSGSLMETLSAFAATATKEQLDRPQVKSGFAGMRSSAVQFIGGELSALTIQGLDDNWRLERLRVLAALAPKAAKFLLPDQLQALRELATSVAGQMTGAPVKAGLLSFAAAMAAK